MFMNIYKSSGTHLLNDRKSIFAWVFLVSEKGINMPIPLGLFFNNCCWVFGEGSVFLFLNTIFFFYNSSCESSAGCKANHSLLLICNCYYSNNSFTYLLERCSTSFNVLSELTDLKNKNHAYCFLSKEKG